MIEASHSKTPATPSPRAVHVAHAWLTAPVYARLAAESQRRRIHPDALTAQIVERVISGGLVEAVLDIERLS